MRLRSLMLITALLSSSLLTTACSSGRGVEGRVASGGGTPADPVVTTSTFKEKCADGSSGVGYIYDDATLASEGVFKDRVSGLVSASMDPASFGDISGSAGAATGIDFRLRLVADSAGVVRDEMTAMQLMIYDSFVGQMNSEGRQIQAYPISISHAQSGHVDNATKTFTVMFSDAYGAVEIKGRWDSTAARGTVRYVNTKHYASGTPAQGTLGLFVIPTCALFK